MLRILIVSFLYISAITSSSIAQAPSEEQIIKEVTLTFLEYQTALESQNYETSFLLEPNFLQKVVGGFENYSRDWLMPGMDEWRRLCYSAAMKEIKVLTPDRAVIFVNLDDERMSQAAFYIFREDARWKVANLDYILYYAKKELENLVRAVKEFYKNNDTLPLDLSELVPEYIELLPIDLFNDKQEPYRYIKVDDKNFKIYSFGPDSKDDFGEKGYNAGSGLFNAGDIIISN